MTKKVQVKKHYRRVGWGWVLPKYTRVKAHTRTIGAGTSKKKPAAPSRLKFPPLW